MILIIYAHPYPNKSHVNREMLKRASQLGVTVRTLYNLYPDFDIDVQAEQQAVEQADLIVLQHPLQWYSTPALLKLWIDKVFTSGWAHGAGAIALKGKSILWAVTANSEQSHLEVDSPPGLSTLAQPLHATAVYCGMRWLKPLLVNGTSTTDTAELNSQIEHYCARLESWKED